MGVADKSAAKISRNSRKLKQSIMLKSTDFHANQTSLSMRVAEKSAAKIFRN